MGFELMIAMVVVFVLFLVLATIELDDKSCGKARKVGDVAGDRHLSPESEPAQLPTPQTVPETPLSIGGAASQRARA